LKPARKLIIEGEVKKFDAKKLIVPHMGWNKIKLQAPGSRLQAKLFKGVKDDTYFYFAHSYYCQPKDKGVVLTTTDYGVRFASSVQKGNIYGVQFHPEKSQKLGLKVFNNFLSM
jgi:imidazole glycerol-phosphate synthase subunit HisH